MMLNYAELLKIPEIIVGMVLVGAIGFVLNELLLLLEKYLFKWRWQVTL
jgi:NitT/TauT family transport system permease protein